MLWALVHCARLEALSWGPNYRVLEHACDSWPVSCVRDRVVCDCTVLSGNVRSVSGLSDLRLDILDIAAP